MTKDKKKISQIEQLILDAKESKHTDAVLLLSEKKPEIQSKVIQLLKETLPETDDEANKKANEAIKKSIATFAEYIFQKCVWILIDDKR